LSPNITVKSGNVSFGLTSFIGVILQCCMRFGQLLCASADEAEILAYLS
jgi:hypothetical protein